MLKIAQTNLNLMRKHSIYAIQCDLKEGELMKEKRDLERAKFIVNQSIENFPAAFKLKHTSPLYSKQTHMEYYVKALDLYAQILHETKSVSPSVIIKEYLDRAVEFAKEHGLKNEHEENVISNSFYSLGKFADEQYQTICDYIKSTSYEEHTELMRQFEIEKDMAKRYLYNCVK